MEGTLAGSQGDAPSLILLHFNLDLFCSTEQAVLGISLRMRDSSLPVRTWDLFRTKSSIHNRLRTGRCGRHGVSDFVSGFSFSKANKSLCFVRTNKIHESQIGIRLAKFSPGAPLATIGVSVETEPIVKDNHGAGLEKVFAEP